MRFYLFKHNGKQSHGFTLIELLVVITIIAIIGGVGYASYTSFSTRQTLDQAAQDLKTGIDQAKHNAISKVKPSSCGTDALDGYRIVICAAGGAGSTACTQAGRSYEVRAVCTGVGSTPVTSFKTRTPGVTTTVSSGECGLNFNNVFYFNSQNGPNANVCRIVLSTTDSTGTIGRIVCIDQGGNVSIKNGTVAACP